LTSNDLLKTQWHKEKGSEPRHEPKERHERAKTEAIKAEREGDLSKAAELKYGMLISLEKDIKDKNEELARIQREGGLLKEEVGPEDIAEVVAKWTGIPVSRMLEGEVDKLLRIEERIGQRVIGQREAIIAVANAVRRARSGLQDPNRPIGSFIFMGPTGVGKTDLRPSRILFEDKEMVRSTCLNTGRHSVARLIGRPDGRLARDT
jgi:ATP-dependent Clp protease ATP-binding subunit ClpB